MLSLLLTPAPSDARKRLPSESNHDLAASIREEMGLSLHQHKGDWPCYYLTHITTFSLPAGVCVCGCCGGCVCVCVLGGCLSKCTCVYCGMWVWSVMCETTSVCYGYVGDIFLLDIRRFCSAVQKRVLDEIVDKDVAKGLNPPPIG